MADDGAGRVLVGFDGSASARAALARAVGEARLRDVALLVVVAWSPPSRLPGAHFGTIAPPDETLQARATDLLDEGLATVPEGVAAEGTVGRGDPARVLLGEARQDDLLVVGSRGRGGFSGLLLGSTSHTVVTHAPCAVLVVPGHPEDLA